MLILVSVILMLSFSLTLAEEIDLSAMSTDELIALRAATEAELNSRLSEGSATIYPGVYVTGIDIRAGIYLFTGLEDSSHLIWSDADGNTIDGHYVEEGEIYQLSLSEGMSLAIYNTPCLIQQGTSLPFAP